jgi:hypothetical protein
MDVVAREGRETDRLSSHSSSGLRPTNAWYLRPRAGLPVLAHSYMSYMPYNMADVYMVV